MSELHHSAADGFSAGATKYVRGRPDYPSEILSWLIGAMQLGPGTSVLDLGAGTGKFTPYLLRTGAHVIAVEPVAQMRQQLERVLKLDDILSGTAVSIPLPDASVDAVVCAQAFHWFASAEALTEIARVLKQGGRFGLVWNTRDKRIDWVRALDDIFEPYAGDAPRYHTGAWRLPFPHARFAPWHEAHFEHAHCGSAEDVVINRVLSISFIGALPAYKQAQVEAQLRALIAAQPSLHGHKDVTMPYDTVAFSMRKLD